MVVVLFPSPRGVGVMLEKKVKYRLKVKKVDNQTVLEIQAKLNIISFILFIEIQFSYKLV